MNHLIPAFVSLAQDALVVFVVVVFVDDLFGVALAVKAKTFDLHKLPSFLASQFGTNELLVVVGAALFAAQTGGDAKQAALAVVTAGSGAMTAAVIKDIYSKIRAFLS